MSHHEVKIAIPIKIPTGDPMTDPDIIQPPFIPSLFKLQISDILEGQILLRAGRSLLPDIPKRLPNQILRVEGVV